VNPSSQQVPEFLQGTFYAAISDFTAVGAAYFDEKLMLRWFNPVYADLIRSYTLFTPEQIAGHSLFDYTYGSRERLEPYLRQVMQSGQKQMLRDTELILEQDGIQKVVYWDCQFTPVYNPSEECAGILMLVQDVTEKHLTACALEQNNLRLQAIFDHGMDAILLVNQEGGFVDANPAACKLLELPRETLLGLTIWQAASRLDWDVYRQRWLEFKAVGYQEGTYTQYDQGNRVKVVAYRAVANIIPGIHLAILTDMTERSQAEERLRATQAMLKSILDYAPMPIYAVGVDGQIQLANRALREFIGSLEAEQLVQDDLLKFLSPETFQQFNETNQAVIESNAAIEREEWVDKPDGRYYFFSVKFPMRAPDGRIEAVGGISVNITSRKRTEMVLQQSELKFRRMVEQSADGITLSNEHGTIIEWNHAQEVITGLPASEVLGEKLWEVQFRIAPDEHKTRENYERLKKSTLGLLSGEESPWLEGLQESELQRPDGERCRIQSHTFLFQGEVGHMAGSITRDVTEQRSTQEEVKQRSKELASLLRISQQLSGKLNLENLLDSAVQAVVETLPLAEAAMLWLFDEKRELLVARAGYGTQKEITHGISSASRESLVWQVYQRGETISLGTKEAVMGMFPSAPAPMDSIQSVIGLPLLLDGRSFGVLTAACLTREAAFDENAERWLQSMAGQVSVMIVNARLFEQVSTGQERLRALSRKLVEVQEAERRQIARELHDEVGQILTGLKLLLKMSSQGAGQKVQQDMNEALALTNDLLRRVHDMSLDLRPAMLDDLGLLPALLWQFDRFYSQTDIKVQFKHHGLEGVRFAPDIETGAYRITQEALTNVARHAWVHEVFVRVVVQQDRLELEIEDHGKGFDPIEQGLNKTSLGLNGMRERVDLLGGSLRLISSPGMGTQLRAVLPLCGKMERNGFDDHNPAGR
jgi:PAS domain S-box-containing protein